MAVMKHHAAYTYYILSDIDDFDEIRDWAAFHHERLDGTGYPFGQDCRRAEHTGAHDGMHRYLSGTDRSRPYKKGMPHEKPARSCGIWRRRAGWMKRL